MVVELGVDVAALRAPETDDRAAVRAHAGVRVRARAPLLPRAFEQLRRARHGPPGVGAEPGGGAARRDRGRSTRRRAPRRHARVVRRRAARRARRPASRARSCTASACNTVTSRRPDVDVAPIGRRARARPARGRGARGRSGADHRAGRFGQDARAHRTVPPARRAARLGSARRSARSPTTCGPRTRCAQRLADVGPGALRKVRTLHALGFDIVRRARDIRDVLDEWDVRRRIEPLVPVRPRANTDVYAPYLEALGEVRLGLVAPERVEARRDDVEGFAAMFDEYRDTLARRRRDRPRRADLRRDRSAAAQRRDPRASCKRSAGTCSSTSSRTSRPRNC